MFVVYNNANVGKKSEKTHKLGLFNCSFACFTFCFSARFGKNMPARQLVNLSTVCFAIWNIIIRGHSRALFLHLSRRDTSRHSHTSSLSSPHTRHRLRQVSSLQHSLPPLNIRQQVIRVTIFHSRNLN